MDTYRHLDLASYDKSYKRRSADKFLVQNQIPVAATDFILKDVSLVLHIDMYH
ncbi:hypothetical protein RvY_06769 [Ramazzottius varieornatus]|uniref:Uncharacterized protein n=1 Tax=Ramazzottius varieornatus TaxID=947166 RepID=A0A1D1V525_RAMVA|nr:hypothetical protein RvY_06769 [Ramazzottius varieornatus]